MNTVTYTRPATGLVLADSTDHKRLYKTLETAVPPLPTDTGHDEVFVKSLELAVEELRLRLCEAHLDGVQQHPVSLWALRTCLELIGDAYVLRINRGDEADVYVQPSSDHGFVTYTASDPTPEPAAWDARDSTVGLRDLARTNSISFVHIHDAP